MKNNKGFTLIELIAAITILSIIMLVAIPNVISVSIKNKNRTYVNDANKMIVLAKYLFESDSNINKPTGTTCLKLTLNSLDRTELQKGPENGDYDLNNSFVIIRYNSGTKQYEYYVQTQEKYKKNSSYKYKGIKIVSYEKLLSTADKGSLVKETSTANDSIWNTGVTGCNTYAGV